MRFAELDAVTVDAYGTLLRLRDPVPALSRLTGRAGDAVRRAFEVEMRYYVPHSLEGRDPETLAHLRLECTRVFNRELGSRLSPEEYVGSLEYEEVPGARRVLEELRARGLAVAVVANWDISLGEQLDRLGLAHLADTVVTSAEAAAAKPDPQIFRVALGRLGLAPERALHVGDSPSDEDGARAAGIRFLPAPLERAFEGWR